MTILSTQLNSLDTELAQLQQQIEQLQAQKQNIAQAQELADTGLDKLKEVLALAPDAASDLKSAVLNLFRDNSGSSDSDGGGEPNPPAPSPDNGSSEVEQSNSSELHTSEYPSNGAGSSDYYEYVLSNYNQAIAYFRRRDDGALGTVYIGCNSKSRAKAWGRQIAELFEGSAHELRRAYRREIYRYELKIWGLSANDIEMLAGMDFRKPPEQNFLPKPGQEQLEARSCELLGTDGSRHEITSIDSPFCKPDLNGEYVELTCGITPQPTQPAEEQLTWRRGDQCEILSDRHGHELFGKVGTITSASSAGCAVSVDGGEANFFRLDEIGSLKKHLATV